MPILPICPCSHRFPFSPSSHRTDAAANGHPPTYPGKLVSSAIPIILHAPCELKTRSICILSMAGRSLAVRRPADLILPTKAGSGEGFPPDPWAKTLNPAAWLDRVQQVESTVGAHWLARTNGWHGTGLDSAIMSQYGKAPSMTQALSEMAVAWGHVGGKPSPWPHLPGLCQKNLRSCQSQLGRKSHLVNTSKYYFRTREYNWRRGRADPRCFIASLRSSSDFPGIAMADASFRTIDTGTPVSLVSHITTPVACMAPHLLSTTSTAQAHPAHPTKAFTPWTPQLSPAA